MPESEPTPRERLSGIVQRVQSAAQAALAKASDAVDAMASGPVQKAAKAAQDATGTGKTIEDRITEYTEVYTQVLLGLHHDVETQREEIAKLHARLDEMERRWRRSERLLRFTAFGAAAVSLAALGGVVWTAL